MYCTAELGTVRGQCLNVLAQLRPMKISSYLALKQVFHSLFCFCSAMIMSISSTVANGLIKTYQTTTLSYTVLIYRKQTALNPFYQ